MREVEGLREVEGMREVEGLQSRHIFLSSLLSSHVS